MNCIYLDAEKVSGSSLPHNPICTFTLLTNVTISGILCTIDTAKGYTSLITADSVTMPFSLRWKPLSSAPLRRDMMTDRVCSQSTANVKCNVLVEPPDYTRLQRWLSPSFESYITSNGNKKLKGLAILTFPFLAPYVFWKLWQQNNFPGFFCKQAWWTEGSHFITPCERGSKREHSTMRPVGMPLITSEICFPISKPVNIPPPMGLCQKTDNRTGGPQVGYLRQL